MRLKKMTICAKCNLEKDPHSVHYSANGEKLYFCSECVWRMKKMGYPDIKSYLNEPVVRENRMTEN